MRPIGMTQNTTGSATKDTEKVAPFATTVQAADALGKAGSDFAFASNRKTKRKSKH